MILVPWMEVLKLPGTEVGWTKRYEEVMKMIEEVEMEEWVWRGVKILGAPGTKEQWGVLVKIVRQKISKLKTWILDLD